MKGHEIDFTAFFKPSLYIAIVTDSDYSNLPSSSLQSDVTGLLTKTPYRLPDTTPEAAFDRITALASLAFAAPIAVVHLVGDGTLSLQSCFGLELPAGGERPEAPLCAHIADSGETLVVPDTERDPRFAEHPLVTGRPVRFYAGAPLRSPEGVILGTLCVLDPEPRDNLTQGQVQTLLELAALAAEVLETRRLTKTLAEERAFMQAVLEHISDGVVACNAAGELTVFNEVTRALYGQPEGPLTPDRWAGRYELLEADGATPLTPERSPLYRAFRGETLRDAEIVVVPPQGSPRRAQVSGRAFYGPDGERLGAVIAARDVTEARRAEAALRELEAHHRSVIDNLTEGVVQQEADGRITTCNPAAERILGLSYAQMVGRDSLDPRWRAVHEDGSPYPGDTHPSMVALRTGEPQQGRMMGVHKPDGTLSWLNISAQPLFHAGDAQPAQPYAVVASFADVTALKDTETQLRHDALHDPLTGLPTRVLLLERLEQAAARAERQQTLHHALLFIDLDGFKAVNDTLGHGAGDELLVRVGGVLSGAVRRGDTVARLGGDEFVVLLEGLTQPEYAVTLTKRLLRELTIDVHVAGTTVAINASVGVALSEAGVSASALLERADAAMYRAKAAGRSRYAAH